MNVSYIESNDDNNRNAAAQIHDGLVENKCRSRVTAMFLEIWQY